MPSIVIGRPNRSVTGYYIRGTNAKTRKREKFSIQQISPDTINNGCWKKSCIKKVRVVGVSGVDPVAKRPFRLAHVLGERKKRFFPGGPLRTVLALQPIYPFESLNPPGESPVIYEVPVSNFLARGETIVYKIDGYIITLIEDKNPVLEENDIRFESSNGDVLTLTIGQLKTFVNYSKIPTDIDSEESISNLKFIKQIILAVKNFIDAYSEFSIPLTRNLLQETYTVDLNRSEVSRVISSPSVPITSSSTILRTTGPTRSTITVS